MPQYVLQDRVVVVTGAGRGIGRAIAIAAAEAGARIAALSRSRAELDETVDLIRRSGGQAAAFVASITDPVGVVEAIDRIARTFGHADVLVNNAGTVGPRGPFSESDVKEWWAAINVNLHGTVLCTHAMLPSMVARRTGRIINVSSGGAATGITCLSSYIVAKTALLRLTECIAAELRPYGLSVFAIGPGTVRTAMAERSLDTDEGRRWLPWFQRIFDEGFDVAADVPARLTVALASGRYDALSGRFVTVGDDLDRLLDCMDSIDREELYALRVKRLPPVREMPPALQAINDAATRPPGFTLRLERSFPFGVDEAFAAWIEPEAIARWFVHGANVRWVDAPQLNPRPGGRFQFRVTGDEGLFDFTGTYREVKPPTRLQFTWRWESIPIIAGSGDTSVSLQFERSEGTRVTLVQEHLPHLDACEAHRRGWERCFDGIAALPRPTDAPRPSGHSASGSDCQRSNTPASTNGLNQS